MSTIYDLNTDQQVVELLPPDKRTKTTVAWLQAALRSTIQFLRDALLDRYRNGSTDSAYAAGIYALGAFVQYQKGVYVSIIPDNTDAPTVTTSWYKVQDNFIGLNERILYNGEKIVMEYALNRWFGTIFRQPGTGLSDIYLSTNAKPLAVFRFGVAENISSSFFLNRSTEGIMNADAALSSFFNLTIFIPVAVYNALDPLAPNREAIVRNFVDKYIYAGITYEITTY